MRKLSSPKSETTCWAKIDEAEQHFRLGRNSFIKLARAANARKKIGKSVIYNLDKIEEYLNNLDC